MLRTYLLLFTCFVAMDGFCQNVIASGSTLKTPDSSAVKINKPVAAIEKPSLKIYPNPATNKITLQVGGFETGMATVKIMDAKGKLWREDKRLLTNGNEDIVMFLLLPAGVYFISVSEKIKVLRKKLIVL